ncbi:(Fe-S)-binding protein [Desulfosporosinus sp. BICA1-9]|uniref:(Fe-S)-binding protein n=1 Tax=Desulfosporosinus sp. BICA1-9 TaxID=1531958 RepID=UPI00054B6CE2|nr:(Fe-S)-binding protein [Desulfosporosinus sp. BICA1-9]KJS50746.1 MAG: Fe-S oxidoreductase [Peptococcaceae bacterium BRH_c23]KJS90350.1 MAG: Fe-S oxidoreductase [Desulfosporosinus sp. BICA1-9]HBW37814.1 (Fe-S)-binding protein [Desulfosporosinus sp.]
MERSFESWEKEVIRCIRCGACQNVCPVFKELQAESTVARGRVKLIRGVISKDLNFTAGLIDKMSLCLMCKACVVNCPSGVKVDKLVEAARKEITAKKGLSPLKNLIFRLVLKNRWVFNTGMRTGRIFQGLIFRKGPNGQGMLPRMSLGIDKRRLLSPLAPKPLKMLYPEVVKVPEATMRVAFFTGCMINYIYTDTGRAVINVLKQNGVEVVIPALQNCCGTPVRINGDYQTAKEMARANIDVLLKEEVDVVVVACGTCGLSLKEEYAELLEDDPIYAEKAKKLGAMIKDFTELVVSLAGFEDKMGCLPIKVTYHDPCHLVRGLKVKEQPRQIIRSIPGLTFEEMSKPDTCCGSAGSFSLYHYELSTKINDHKVESIKQTDAEVLVTGCSACRMHIADGLNRQGVSVQVMHTAQLLEMAYDAKQNKGS